MITTLLRIIFCISKYSRVLQKYITFNTWGIFLSKDKIYERDVLLSAFSERLQQAINASSFAKQGQGVLSAQLGVSRQALRKWLNGKTLPSQTRLPMIADLLKTDLAWLATGIGEVRNINAEVPDANSLEQAQFSLNVSEMHLLQNYRKLPNETQKLFSDLFGNLTILN